MERLLKQNKKIIIFFLAMAISLCIPIHARADQSKWDKDTQKVIDYLKKDGEKKNPVLWGCWKYGVKDAIDNWVVFIKTVMGMGLSPQAASAIAGNVYAESGFDSGTLENGLSYEEVVSRGDRGIGYFQWTDFERKNAFLDFAKKNGKPWQDREIQIAYFWEETLKDKPTQGEWWAAKNTKYKDIYAKYRCEPYATKEEFMKDTDIERATVLFARNWERPNANVAHFERRIGFAKDSYEVLTKLLDVSNLSKSNSVGLVNKYRTDASVEELQMARGVKMFQNSVLMQIQTDTLTNEERFGGQQIHSGVKRNEEDKKFKTVAEVVGSCGWVLVAWGITSLIVWLMAHNNSLVAQKAIKILLFNKGSEKISGLYASLALLVGGVFVVSGLFFRVMVGIIM